MMPACSSPLFYIFMYIIFYIYWLSLFFSFSPFKMCVGDYQTNLVSDMQCRSEFCFSFFFHLIVTIELFVLNVPKGSPHPRHWRFKYSLQSEHKCVWWITCWAQILIYLNFLSVINDGGLYSFHAFYIWSFKRKPLILTYILQFLSLLDRDNIDAD